MSPEEIAGRTTTRPDGGVSVLIPGDPDLIARREGALSAFWQEERESWEAVHQALPARSETQSPPHESRKRHAQDLSLGRRPRGSLWAMERGTYLRQLAGLFPVLNARLALLPAGRGFVAGEWLTLRPQVPSLREEAEQAAALFLVFVADGPWTTRGHEAGASALCQGMLHWRAAERAAFARWSLHPFFPGEDA